MNRQAGLLLLPSCISVWAHASLYAPARLPTRPPALVLLRPPTCVTRPAPPRPLAQGPLSRLMAGEGADVAHADYEALTQVHCCLVMPVGGVVVRLLMWRMPTMKRHRGVWVVWGGEGVGFQQGPAVQGKRSQLWSPD